jgi:hypothetical protein
VRAWTPVGGSGGTELRVSCYEVAPGAALDVATDGERIVFVSEGSTALENGSAAATLGRWTGAFIKAGEAVRLRNDGSTPARVIECCPVQA